MLTGIMGELAKSFRLEIRNPQLVLFHEREPGTSGAQRRQFDSRGDSFNDGGVTAINADSNQSFPGSEYNDATFLINRQPSTLGHCFRFEGG